MRRQSGRPTRQARRLAHLASLSLSLATTACAVLPERAAVPATLSASAVARQVTVRGPDGPVSAAAESHTLAAVQAEGHGELLARQLGTLAAQDEANLYRGNSAELLVDGPATFAAMKQAIALARHRVLVESYIFEDAGIAAEVGALLLQRAAAGVAVALVYDSVGSWGTDAGFFDRLAAGGVTVCAFNPLQPWQRPGGWSLAGINHRDHRKLMVVDAEVAFTGGINIARVYSSGSFRRRRAAADDASAAGWRDTQIALRGPVVGALAEAFADTWASQGCPGALAPAPRPARAAAGTRVVKVLATRPGGERNPIYSALLAAIDSAQRSVHLTMAYFAPGADLVQALGDAARRGVDVVLLLPGRSDFALVLHAGRSHYAQLLAAGVQIHELQQALLHAKTAVIDGVWATVGSSNLDWRSLAANSELNVVVLGDDFGQQMEAMFRRDLATAPAIDPAAWAQRGWRDRALQQLGRLLERWL